MTLVEKNVLIEAATLGLLGEKWFLQLSLYSCVLPALGAKTGLLFSPPTGVTWRLPWGLRASTAQGEAAPWSAAPAEPPM